MNKIIFVSHCILNTAAKVKLYDMESIAAEEDLRRRFLRKALDSGVQIVQLPCPEFTLYGAKRWGHVSEQFDQPFFREHCRRILEPVILELREYLAQKDGTQVIGIVGINGSPSCGVEYTCHADWGGSFEGRTDTMDVINSCRLGPGSGVFMDVLREMLQREEIDLPVTGLWAPTPETILSLLD